MRARVPYLLLLLACFVGDARAATFGALLDNTIYQNTPSNSDGQGPDMYVGDLGSRSGSPGSPRRGLIQFDLSAIPPGSIVTSVTLTLKLTLSAGGSSGTTPVTLHEMLASWGEGASSAPVAGGLGVAALPGDATWTNRFWNGATWTTPGGDFDAVVSSTANVGQVASGSSLTVNWLGAGIQGDVQEWVDHPNANFGWILIGDETGVNNARRFATAENVTVSLRPVLTVNFTVPEPQTAALFFVAGGMLLARRRGNTRAGGSRGAPRVALRGFPDSRKKRGMATG
jgi:hypothetical protein